MPYTSSVIGEELRQTIGPSAMPAIWATLIHQAFGETVTQCHVSQPHGWRLPRKKRLVAEGFPSRGDQTTGD